MTQSKNENDHFDFDHLDHNWVMCPTEKVNGLKSETVVYPAPIVIGPFHLRFRSVSSPFPIMGGKWDLQGIYIGITWDLQQRQIELSSRKKNSYYSSTRHP